jgi:hypothetical protein
VGDVNRGEEGLAATTAMSRPATVAELREALAALSLDPRGNKDTLRKRLARATRSLSRSSSPPRQPARERQTRPPDQLYDSFLVFDVEATCEQIEGPWGKLAFACVRGCLPLFAPLCTAHLLLRIYTAIRTRSSNGP